MQQSLIQNKLSGYNQANSVSDNIKNTSKKNEQLLVNSLDDLFYFILGNNKGQSAYIDEAEKYFYQNDIALIKSIKRTIDISDEIVQVKETDYKKLLLEKWFVALGIENGRMGIWPFYLSKLDEVCSGLYHISGFENGQKFFAQIIGDGALLNFVEKQTNKVFTHGRNRFFTKKSDVVFTNAKEYITSINCKNAADENYLVTMYTTLINDYIQNFIKRNEVRQNINNEFKVLTYTKILMGFKIPNLINELYNKLPEKLKNNKKVLDASILFKNFSKAITDNNNLFKKNQPAPKPIINRAAQDFMDVVGHLYKNIEPSIKLELSQIFLKIKNDKKVQNEFNKFLKGMHKYLIVNKGIIFNDEKNELPTKGQFYDELKIHLLGLNLRELIKSSDSASNYMNPYIWEMLIYGLSNYNNSKSKSQTVYYKHINEFRKFYRINPLVLNSGYTFKSFEELLVANKTHSYSFPKLNNSIVICELTDEQKANLAKTFESFKIPMSYKMLEQVMRLSIRMKKPFEFYDNINNIYSKLTADDKKENLETAQVVK